MNEGNVVVCVNGKLISVSTVASSKVISFDLFHQCLDFIFI